ncbi:hypothetical protein FRC20_000827 [Serendipita sp. 405]|nr:hypothetical protein FRC20_000827 [Serendipita sp. 405]
MDIIGYAKFQSPQLKYWNLRCRAHERLPDIDAPHVRWNFDLMPSFEALMDAITRFFAVFKGTKSLKIGRSNHSTHVFARLRELKEENSLPICLEKIEVEGAGTLYLTMND